MSCRVVSMYRRRLWKGITGVNEKKRKKDGELPFPLYIISYPCQHIVIPPNNPHSFPLHGTVAGVCPLSLRERPLRPAAPMTSYRAHGIQAPKPRY